MGEVSDKTDKPPGTRFFQLTSWTFVHTQRSADSLRLTCSLFLLNYSINTDYRHRLFIFFMYFMFFFIFDLCCEALLGTGWGADDDDDDEVWPVACM